MEDISRVHGRVVGNSRGQDDMAEQFLRPRGDSVAAVPDSPYGMVSDAVKVVEGVSRVLNRK